MSQNCNQTCEQPLARAVRSSDGLDDALRILIRISKEYENLCDVMLTMPERRNELRAGTRFMDALENLRDELLKRKSSNDRTERQPPGGALSTKKETL